MAATDGSYVPASSPGGAGGIVMDSVPDGAGGTVAGSVPGGSPVTPGRAPSTRGITARASRVGIEPRPVRITGI